MFHCNGSGTNHRSFIPQIIKIFLKTLGFPPKLCYNYHEPKCFISTQLGVNFVKIVKGER